MEKFYISVEGAKKGDVIYFDMPPFCSGNYSATIMKDPDGWLYIDRKNNYFDACVDYRLNNPYWENPS